MNLQRILDRRLLGHAAQREIVDDISRRLTSVALPSSHSTWLKRVAATRKAVLDLLFLGHPRELLNARPAVRRAGVIETGTGYRIVKLLYEGYPGMWIPALLYEPTSPRRGKLPVVLNPNGHHVGGKAMDYKQARCINLAKRGMLALSTEFIGMGELRADGDHNRIALLDLCGISGVGVFYLALKRSLDLLLAHPRADTTRVACTGLSGGGWQTALLSALDERVHVIVPVAGYSPAWQRCHNIEDIGDLEQVPSDFCTLVDYDVLTAMFAPRPTLLIYNRYDDCCFKTSRTRKSVFQPARPAFELFDAADNFELHDNVDPGTHNYDLDNRRHLYRFLDRHFGLETSSDDLPWKEELLTENELNVGVPADNTTLHSLALSHLTSIKRKRLREPVHSGRNLKSADQKRAARKRLLELIRLQRFSAVTPRHVGVRIRRRGFQFQHAILHLDRSWSLPLTEFTPVGRARDLEIVIGDGGRGTTTTHAERALASGFRVLVADLFDAGEVRFDHRLEMLMSSSGVRPLGVQVGQLLTLINWARRRYRANRVRITAVGSVLPVATLMAIALHPGRFSHYNADRLMVSLHRLIEWPVPYQNEAPLFCFGLLAEFDIPDLLELAAPVSIVDANRGPLTS